MEGRSKLMTCMTLQDYGVSISSNRQITPSWRRFHLLVDVQTSSRNAGSDHNRHLSGTECTNRILAFELRTIGMNGGAWKVHVEQAIIQFISSSLRIDEDDGTARRCRKKQFNKSRSLSVCLDKLNILLNVGMGRTSTANANANMVMSEASLQRQ